MNGENEKKCCLEKININDFRLMFDEIEIMGCL